MSKSDWEMLWRAPRPQRLDLERDSARFSIIQRMTVLEVLQSATAYFKKREIDSPRLNAEHLVAHALRRKRIELYLEFERALGEAELTLLRKLVRRRGEGEPLQHLLGTVEFCGHTFLCDKRALVPRPETEQLVELVISKFQFSNPNFRMLDVGTGSGVIALTLAKEFSEAEVFAVDISEDALALARENAERLGLSDRVDFKKSNLLEDIDETFDLIVANLPYIAAQDRPVLSREVLYDPEVALFSGVHGDELVRELIAQAPARLRPGGMLALEVGLGQSEALFSILAGKNYRDICLKNDYSGRPRFLFARYG
jgi:release factor glutamine methyltransferase